MDKPALLVLPATVHQAEGALVARLGVPVEEAAELLRAQARVHGITVEEMADEVLPRSPVFVATATTPDSTTAEKAPPRPRPDGASPPGHGAR